MHAKRADPWGSRRRSRGLVRKATEAGQSLQHYLYAQLVRVATTPTVDDVIARIEQRAKGTLTRKGSTIRGQVLAAPDLLRVEVVCVLRRHAARGTITARQARNALTDLLVLLVFVYPTAALLPRCWELRGNITAYDATYVALAEALNCVVVTCDAKLSNAPGLAARSTSSRNRRSPTLTGQDQQPKRLRWVRKPPSSPRRSGTSHTDGSDSSKGCVT